MKNDTEYDSLVAQNAILRSDIQRLVKERNAYMGELTQEERRELETLEINQKNPMVPMMQDEYDRLKFLRAKEFHGQWPTYKEFSELHELLTELVENGIQLIEAAQNIGQGQYVGGQIVGNFRAAIAKAKKRTKQF